MKKWKNIFLIIGLISFLLTSYSCTDDPYTIPEPDTSPPQALIVFPIDGEPVSETIIIEVRANDNEGIDSVVLFINQQRIEKDSTSDNSIYKYVWNTDQTEMINETLVKTYEEDEFHYISVVAYDYSQNKYASAPIRSFVDNIDNEAPSAFFLSPFAGQYISGLINITVIATDNRGIQYVSYFVNNVLQGYILPTENSSTFEFPWNTSLEQSGDYYSLHANVRDNNNNITIIPPISVLVDNGIQNDITPPTGSIVSPPAGLNVSGDVQIIISASDNRAMGEVELSIDGIYITTLENAPYNYVWDTLNESEDMEHTISVILIDLTGNETPLNPISVVVNNDPINDNSPPSVLIMEPAAGQNVSGIVPIEVLANDDSGIKYVEFHINGVLDNIDSIAPYIHNWNTNLELDDMEHIIAVIGYDNEYNSTLAQPIAVYVNNLDNVPPSGQILNPIPGQELNGQVIIQIQAEDNIGVNQIELSIDGLIRDTLLTFPFSYNWDTRDELDDENYVISAIISDDFGNLFYAPPVSVFIDNDINDITPPIGTISNPFSGQTVSGEVNFTVLAEDDYGISNVLFFINGEQVSIDSSAPFNYIWNTTELENSQYTLSSTITDNFEHTIILQPILVTVDN